MNIDYIAKAAELEAAAREIADSGLLAGERLNINPVVQQTALEAFGYLQIEARQYRLLGQLLDRNSQ